nr:unnamed protein product [Spirometra erinaceieuropaei]
MRISLQPRRRPHGDSTPLTEKTLILRRCAEHLKGVLNRPFTISDAVIASLPQVETNADLALPPFPHETIKAAQQFFSEKEHESF